MDNVGLDFPSSPNPTPIAEPCEFQNVTNTLLLCVCVLVADEKHVEKRREAVHRIKSTWSEHAVSDSAAPTFTVEVLLHNPEGEAD